MPLGTDPKINLSMVSNITDRKLIFNLMYFITIKQVIRL